MAEDNLEATHYSSLIDRIKKVIFNLKNESEYSNLNDYFSGLS
jgi:hypothetical protein